MKSGGDQKKIRSQIYKVIFEADTPGGKAFDVALLILILYSVISVMIETVPGVLEKYGRFFLYSEWVVTLLFTCEYFLRIYSAPNPRKYIFSFYGIVDLLSILPSFVGLFFEGTHYMVTIRALRLLRIFRILKLGNYLIESQVLVAALKASRHKITVFLGTVIIVVCIIGSVMYVIEGNEDSGFSSIPRSMYWAIVTVTTVGYGDISPVTTTGQILASLLMIIGYGVLAVPTGIVSVELAHATRKQQEELTPDTCLMCNPEDHDIDANYCKFCGTKFD